MLEVNKPRDAWPADFDTFVRGVSVSCWLIQVVCVFRAEAMSSRTEPTRSPLTLRVQL